MPNITAQFSKQFSCLANGQVQLRNGNLAQEMDGPNRNSKNQKRRTRALRCQLFNKITVSPCLFPCPYMLGTLAGENQLAICIPIANLHIYNAVVIVCALFIQGDCRGKKAARSRI